MKKLLTIVIPAYNMEKYLQRCLDSIIIESVMDKVQVLVVNDGSKDKTSEIAHQYENMFPQYIQVIDKDNGNYGSCMNIGLSLAEGKYFRTLDADDWYDTTNYEKFVDDLSKTNADMIVCERCDYYEETGQIKNIKFNKDVVAYQDLPFISKYWNNDNFFILAMIWGIVYKTEIVRNSGLHWDENVFYTDNEYNFWPLKLVQTIRFFPLPVYIYLLGREDQSVNSKIQKKNLHSYEVVANSMMDELNKTFDSNDEIKEVKLRFVNRILCPFYSNILNWNFNNFHAIDRMNLKLHIHNEVFNFFNDLCTFRGIKYIEAYIKNKKLILLYLRIWKIIEPLRYRIVTNRILRKMVNFIH